VKPDEKPNLRDQFGRTIEYLRLSVTDRCDLRCFYCIPEGFTDFQEPKNWLNFDEIELVVRAFTELGTHRVRITGGEPLVRKNLDQLAKRLASLPGLNDLSLSSNGTRLQKMATKLVDSGVSRINVSLDSLNPERYKEITKGKLSKVIDGLLAAKAAGLAPIKINTVLMKGINETEISDLIEFCMLHHFTLRFIETMPLGDTGRAATDYYFDLSQLRKKLEKEYQLIPDINTGGGPAKYWRTPDNNFSIGFITPLSQHFCETCNRVRLSVDGTLYMCLGQEHNVELRPLLRDGISLEELKIVIQDAIQLKPERHFFNENPSQLVRG